MQLFRGNLFFVCFHLTIHFLKYRQKRGDPLLEHVNNFPFRKQEILRTSEAISPLRHYSSLRMFQSKQNHSSPGPGGLQEARTRDISQHQEFRALNTD